MINEARAYTPRAALVRRGLKPTMVASGATTVETAKLPRLDHENDPVVNDCGQTDCQLDTKTAVGGAMSKYRVSFLVWWTTIVLFIAIFIWLNRDLLPTPAYDLTFFAGWAVMIFALGSWIPGAFLRLLRPELSR